IALLEEPAAVVIDEDLDEGIALAVDFGGGTFDVAIIEFHPDGGEVTALKGAAIGGELFDQVLFDSKVAPVLGLNQTFSNRGHPRALPNWFRIGMSTLSGLKHLLSNPTT